MHIFKLLALALALCVHTLPLHAALLHTTEQKDVTYYISPQGNDKAKGTLKKPLRSIHKAQQLATDHYGKRTVNFVFMDGIHYLDSCIVIRPHQRGTDSHRVTYKAQHNGKAILSGGKALQLKWEKWNDSIFVAQTADPSVAAIDQLYINGKRKPQARYPNANGKNVFGAWDLSHTAKRNDEADLFHPQRVARWKHPEGAYIHAMHASLWGDMHWIVTGKTDGKLEYMGGWQNNRPSAMHKVYRIIENVFEELDQRGEWYYDAQKQLIYYYPEADEKLSECKAECVLLTELMRFEGSEQATIAYTSVEGLVLKHTSRTFMENKEPLLRSDWTICRKGAISLEGTAHCSIKHCEFDQVGGNAICANGYNRKLAVYGCYIHHSGANGICFVGYPSSVRSPLFSYGKQDYDLLDRTPGPANQEFPDGCSVEECVITRTGRVEKQTAPIQISMSRGIKVRHCSIYDVPRAGINISEGTFGGHIIEHCDVFNTVLETGDHGSFNSWGRDRFWSPDINYTVAKVTQDSTLTGLDMSAPNIIRNSRWRCDHGWDIDLDDGSSHYRIYNNVLLNGGLKLREGYDRVVINNVVVNNSLHPHVWYRNSGDVVKHNIFFEAYKPVAMNVCMGEDEQWGKEIDHNFFVGNDAGMKRFARNNCDRHSLAGQPLFVDAAHGDYRVSPQSGAITAGFENFDMNEFGVTLPYLRQLAKTPLIPETLTGNQGENEGMALWHGAKVKNIETLGEQSATGLKDRKGVLVTGVAPLSQLAHSGLQTNDVILAIDGVGTDHIDQLTEVESKARNCNRLTLTVWRNQQAVSLKVKFY